MAVDDAKNVQGCYDAAVFEGLHSALEETEDARLKDLIERRLLPAFADNHQAQSRIADILEGKNGLR